MWDYKHTCSLILTLTVIEGFRFPIPNPDLSSLKSIWDRDYNLKLLTIGNLEQVCITYIDPNPISVMIFLCVLLTNF